MGRRPHARVLVVRTLLVEDNGPLRVLLRILLEQARSFEVVGEAGNGREAIQEARRLTPDLVLLDLLMPVMGGVEALPELRRVVPNAKIVVHSMLGERAREQSLRAGADAFLDKSLRDEQLIDLLNEIAAPTPRVAPPSYSA